MDSGCNDHLSGNLEAMENVREIINPGYIEGFRNLFTAARSNVGNTDITECKYSMNSL